MRKQSFQCLKNLVSISGKGRKKDKNGWRNLIFKLLCFSKGTFDWVHNMISEFQEAFQEKNVLFWKKKIWRKSQTQKCAVKYTYSLHLTASATVSRSEKLKTTRANISFPLPCLPYGHHSTGLLQGFTCLHDRNGSRGKLRKMGQGQSVLESMNDLLCAEKWRAQERKKWSCGPLHWRKECLQPLVQTNPRNKLASQGNQGCKTTVTGRKLTGRCSEPAAEGKWRDGQVTEQKRWKKSHRLLSMAGKQKNARKPFSMHCTYTAIKHKLHSCIASYSVLFCMPTYPSDKRRKC